MPQLNQQFDPHAHEAMADFSPVPKGDYLARIVKSEMKATKDGQGSYLELEFDLMAPGYTDRKVWTRLNLVNKNPKAVTMANRELKSICDAVWVGAIMNSDLLHGKPMILALKVTPATAQYGESNEITAYKSAGNNPALAGAQATIPGMEQAGAAAAQPAAAQPAAAAEKPAWA